MRIVPINQLILGPTRFGLLNQRSIEKIEVYEQSDNWPKTHIEFPDVSDSDFGDRISLVTMASLS